jgi:response regulator NasT
MTLRVLLVDRHEAGPSTLERALSAEGYRLLGRVAPDAGLPDAVRRLAPDVVVVDLALPDDATLGCLSAITCDQPTPIVMFAAERDHGVMARAIAAGVVSYNVVAAGTPDIEPIVTAALAMFRRHRQVEAELQQARLALSERDTVDRAKAMLMKQRKFDEPQAYHWLRRKAMSESKRIATVAAELLATPPDSSAQ